jgi:hypothetical protein
MKTFKQLREATFAPKQIKMAIGVASDKRYAGGNYSGAVKAIEKIKRGLSKHPQVAAVLKRQNEMTEGKMSEIDAMRKAGKSAQQIAKAMKIPVKIIKDLIGEEVQGKQLVHHGQLTKNFDICPSALKAFDDNQKAGMGDKEGFHDAVVAVDKYLGIEKRLVAKGSASEAEMKMMVDAVNDAKQKISAAGLPGHTYHQIHIDAVKRLM